MGSARSKGVKGIVTPKSVLFGMAAVVILLIIALATAIVLTIRSDVETEEILIDSVKTELIASSIGAREILHDHMDLFNELNSQEDVDEHWAEWLEVVNDLSVLNDAIDGEYIYALKEIDGIYYFVFDTDPEVRVSHDVFTPYELSPVHERAFEGEAAADIMNVDDEWGSYNTGAVPLYDEDGKQVGIVSTDMDDVFIERNRDTSAFYSTSLIIAVGAAAVVMLIILFMLIRRNSRVQEHLFKLANFDAISGLPNRNNLFTFLGSEIDHLVKDQHPFAVFFIDLDNFKSVNDNAGHDTGDELLCQIALFLSDFADSCDYAELDYMEPLTARIGGDEFLQLIPGITTPEEASRYAENLLRAFGEYPALVEFIKTYHVGLSIGISLFPSMETDYDELIKFADIAMYHAKNNGKNNYRLYDISMGDDVEGAELIVRTNKGTSR